VVVCLELRAGLHMAQLMPLPLTICCFSKIQIGFTFLVPALRGSPGKRAIKQVCVTNLVLMSQAVLCCCELFMNFMGSQSLYYNHFRGLWKGFSIITPQSGTYLDETWNISVGTTLRNETESYDGICRKKLELKKNIQSSWQLHNRCLYYSSKDVHGLVVLIL